MRSDKHVLYVRRHGEYDRKGQVLRNAHAVGLMTDNGGVELSTDNYGRAILRTNEGHLVLRPACANTVHVEVERGGSGYLKEFIQDEDVEQDRRDAVLALDRLHLITNDLLKTATTKTVVDREDIVRKLRLIGGQIGRVLR